MDAASGSSWALAGVSTATSAHPSGESCSAWSFPVTGITASLLHERLHAQPDWQLAAVSELEQRLEDLLVDALGWLISPHVLLAEHLADANHVSGKAARPEGIRRDVRRLAHGHSSDLGLVDIDPDAN